MCTAILILNINKTQTNHFQQAKEKKILEDKYNNNNQNRK